MKARLDSGQKQLAETTGDEEFDRAARKAKDDTVEVAKSPWINF